MAGINPATGKFDPYYTPSTNYKPPVGTTTTSTTNKAGVTTFTNNKWTISGPDGGAPIAPAAGPAPTTAATTTTQTDNTPAYDPDAYAKAETARLEALRRKNAAAVLEGLMGTYGLGSLMGTIDGWIQQGYDPQAIEALIRQSPEYASRFPAMKELQAKGQSMSEAAYIEYEQTMTQYESLYGLPKGMLSDREMVRKLLVAGKSAREVAENADRASASIYKLPQEFRDTMQRYYGISSGGLTAYFMDPDVATPLLEKQFVSAQIGMEAWRQKVDVGASISEELYTAGVTREQAREGFGKVALQGEFTGGAGETTTQGGLIDAELKNDAAAQTKNQRIGASRAGRFQGGGSFTGGKSGMTGIGASST